MRRLIWMTSGTALACAGAATLWMSGLAPISAADHFDPPQRTDQGTNPNADIAADLADLYLFPTPGSVVVSMDFGGPRPATESARYDRNVVYNINISNAGAKTDSEITIEFRFGQDATNPAASGIRITGLPGMTTPFVGPVETTLTTPNGIKIFVGLIDDPFNFDVTGFRLTRETGNLMISNQRNRFTGENSTAVVIEIPRALIENGTNPIAAWGTSGRIS